MGKAIRSVHETGSFRKLLDLGGRVDARAQGMSIVSVGT
jgi:hypothetical protein